jgi:hypothetical protein
MNKPLLAIVVSTSAALLALGIMASEHEYEHGHEREYEGNSDPALHRLPARQQALYEQECGGCHLAYPPALLPAASWRTVMGGLADHFGDNAELEPANAEQITAILVGNAADQAPGEYASRTRRATQGRALSLRITGTDYFRGKHHEIPAKMVLGNPQVASFSRCDACHTRAASGSFDEHEVKIPGYGRFED